LQNYFCVNFLEINYINLVPVSRDIVSPIRLSGGWICLSPDGVRWYRASP